MCKRGRGESHGVHAATLFAVSLRYLIMLIIQSQGRYYCPAGHGGALALFLCSTTRHTFVIDRPHAIGRESLSEYEREYEHPKLWDYSTVQSSYSCSQSKGYSACMRTRRAASPVHRIL